MKTILFLTSFCYLVLLPNSSSGQAFWTETFGTGCNSGTLANGFTSTNGIWSVTATGVNGANANLWYVSAEENGVGVGVCGSGCGTNPTLHIGRADGDVGATYLKDNATGDPTTDIRVESPTIDCSNECQIQLSFEFIHNGDLELDNCTIWYFDGIDWMEIDSPKKTLLTCAPNGLWELYAIYLPSSANNNPNVKIGFQWVNNADGLGTDPSIAIYNIQLASIDFEDPIITCVAEVDVYLNQNCDAQIPDLRLPPNAIVSDNCTSIADLLVTQSIPSGTAISGHLSTQDVEVTVADLAGNSNSCLITVNALDTISPVLDCPLTPVPAYANSSCIAQLDNYTTRLNPIDNCTGFANLIFTQSPVAGTSITSDQIVEFIAEDDAGNTRSCSFIVEFLDTISPVIVCPTNQTQETAAGTCDSLILDYRNMIIWSDNCTLSALDVTFTQIPPPLSIVSGTSAVEISVEDPSGNVSSCFFNLEIIDIESPEITCPSNQSQATNAACNINLNDFTNDAILLDNCSSFQDMLIQQSPSVGSIHSGLGSIIQVSLTATDEAGNSNVCVFDVELIDTTAPEVFCPVNQVVNADANCEYSLTDFTGSMAATDNCTSIGDFVFNQLTPIGTVLNTGIHTVSMEAVDQSSNIGTCSFTVEVIDVTNPTIIDCAPDQLVLLETGCEGVLGDYTSLVNASDNCDVASLIIVQSPAPNTFISTNTTVTITVTDLSSNSSQCTFNVLVEDQEAPVLTCPTDSVVHVNSICAYDAPDLTLVITGMDNCSAFGDMSISQIPAAGTLLSGVDQIEITLTDENGNSTSCIVETIPNDIEAPQITCPADEVINNGASCDYTIPDYTGLAVVVENCPDFTIAQIPSVGTTVPVGYHNITIAVTDISGNQEACSFSIEIIENVSPTILCPADIAQCDPNVSYSAPIANDNCLVFTVSQTDLSGLTSGDVFPIGTTIQTYEVSDVSGNTASCSFTIEILESPDIAQILSTPTSLCDTTSVVLNAAAVNAGTGEWFVIAGSATLNNQFANSTGANNLNIGLNQFVWQVSSAQCGVTSDTISIMVYDLPFPASIPNDTLLICNDTLINLSANTPNVGIGNWYSPNDSINFVNISLSNTAAFNLSDGWNDIIWEISNGTCPVSSDTVRVFLPPKAEIAFNDTTICVTENELQLIGNEPPPGMESLWYIIQGTANIVSNSNSETEMNGISGGENSVVYALIHPVCGNSFDTLNVTVEKCEEYNPLIPTVFTPNNDGRNDLFIIDNLHALYPESEVKIVNRWGNLVFESEGYLNPWDGTMLGSGELLPAGTYFYRIYLNDEAMTEITGPISIIR